MIMTPQLKASFTDDEREAAASIGTASEDPLQNKIAEVFKTLDDPLLSISDIAALLLAPEDGALDAAMLQLVTDGVLESSTDTQRPLDEGSVELYRRTDLPFTRLVVTALEARLPGTDKSIFQWTGDGRVTRALARVSRLDAVSGQGQQRAEIKKHVEDIARGIENGAQVPNSLLLVFLEEYVVFHDSIDDGEEVPPTYIRVRPLSEFLSTDVPGSAETRSLQQVRVVEIDFPYRKAAFDEEKVALLVDGQQRTAGLSLVSVDKVPSFDFPVNAVIADEDQAKEVFALANQTVKIAADFERALVAAMTDVPPYLRADRVPAQVCHKLALTDQESPFRGLVKYPGAPRDKSQVVAYNTLFLIAHQFTRANLLDSDRLQDADLVEAVLRMVFSAIKDTWPRAWGKRPTESRLMHGAGLRAMAAVIFNRILFPIETSGIDLTSQAADQATRNQLRLLSERVVWTKEEADGGPRTVAEFYYEQIANRQNTSQDIKDLTERLDRELKRALLHEPVL